MVCPRGWPCLGSRPLSMTRPAGRSRPVTPPRLGSFILPRQRRSSCRFGQSCPTGRGSRTGLSDLLSCRGNTGDARAGTCASLLRRSPQVRFLPPVLAGGSVRKGKPTGDGNRFENGRAMSLAGSTPAPSAVLFSGVRSSGRTPAFQAGDVGSNPTLRSRGSANGRLSGLEPDGGGSNPPPRAEIADSRFRIPDHILRSGIRNPESGIWNPSQTDSGAVAVGSDAWL